MIPTKSKRVLGGYGVESRGYGLANEGWVQSQGYTAGWARIITHKVDTSISINALESRMANSLWPKPYGQKKTRDIWVSRFPC